MQDRFGLIVGRVSGDDKARPDSPGYSLQRRIAGSPGGGLDALAASAGRNIDRGRDYLARQAVRATQLFHKRLIGVRLRARSL